MEIGEDDFRTELPCPYCGEDFDMSGLCHHITDEHAVEAKTGVLLHSLVIKHIFREKVQRKPPGNSRQS